jgi:hypothetical protein
MVLLVNHAHLWKPISLRHVLINLQRIQTCRRRNVSWDVIFAIIGADMNKLTNCWQNSLDLHSWPFESFLWMMSILLLQQRYAFVDSCQCSCQNDQVLVCHPHWVSTSQWSAAVSFPWRVVEDSFSCVLLTNSYGMTPIYIPGVVFIRPRLLRVMVTNVILVIKRFKFYEHEIKKPYQFTCLVPICPYRFTELECHCKRSKRKWIRTHECFKIGSLWLRSYIAQTFLDWKRPSSWLPYKSKSKMSQNYRKRQCSFLKSYDLAGDEKWKCWGWENVSNIMELLTCIKTVCIHFSRRGEYLAQTPSESLA